MSSFGQFASQQAPTALQHRAALDIYSDPQRFRNVSIICTIGPKTCDVESLTKLREAGMNIVRMNFSHGSYEYHGNVIANTRKSIKENALEGSPIAIALDTKGPEIRTGNLAGDEDAMLNIGTSVTISVKPEDKGKCSESLIFMDYQNLPKVMSVGGVIFIDDGLISLEVTEIPDSTTLKAKVMNSGKLGSHKGVNLPDVDVDLPALSTKDQADLQFGVEQGVDMIFASFIRKKSDVVEVRECLGEAGKDIRIISKIENHEGVRNFDEILEVTDGVMVARGDLGIEIPPEKVFVAQKMMIAKCNMAGKPVICATQMLESMTVNPRPTRAEVSDVANAVLDGSDCVMLSGETAKGKYPLEAVQMMSNVCLEAESAMFLKSTFNDFMATLQTPLPTKEAVALSAAVAAKNHNCKAIITLTNTGEAMRMLSKFRPACPILVCSRVARTARIAHLYRGCLPFFYPRQEKTEPWQVDVEERVSWVMEQAKKIDILNVGDAVIVVHGSGSGVTHKSLTDFHMRVVD